MLPRWYSSLLIWDKVLIILFIVFSTFLITALAVMSAPERRRWAYRKISQFADRLESWTEIMRDDERFDPEWMNEEAWKRTRPYTSWRPKP